ncbi:MAG: tyrosine-type recombinase/integrase [Phycisphaerales bacterium]|nr:tyrosine-type recombinase/integrase [Phycisphaerales bacterium]
MRAADRHPVFCTLRGRSMSDAYVRVMFKRLAARAGIEKRVHAHGLRHTHAAQLRAEGVDIAIISRQLGHASITTTARYLDHLAPRAVIETIRGRMWVGASRDADPSLFRRTEYAFGVRSKASATPSPAGWSATSPSRPALRTTSSRRSANPPNALTALSPPSWPSAVSSFTTAIGNRASESCGYDGSLRVDTMALVTMAPSAFANRPAIHRSA